MKLFKDKIGQGIGRNSILIAIFIIVLAIVMILLSWDVAVAAVTKLKLLF